MKSSAGEGKRGLELGLPTPSRRAPLTMGLGSKEGQKEGYVIRIHGVRSLVKPPTVIRRISEKAT